MKVIFFHILYCAFFLWSFSVALQDDLEVHVAVQLFRDTMIQALRCVIQPAGDKMSENVRKGILSTLGGLLSHDNDSTRLCAAGAIGVLLPWLPPDDLRSALTQYVLGL